MTQLDKQIELDDLTPGDVLVARVIQPHERLVEGKPRPVVFVEAYGGKASCAGLTTNWRYGDGTPRVRLGWKGGTGPTYLWGGKLLLLPLSQIDRVIGRLSEDDWTKVRQQHGWAS